MSQIFHIWNDFFYIENKFSDSFSDSAIKQLYHIICKEVGRKKLYTHPLGANVTHKKQIELYFEEQYEAGKILDLVSMIFFMIKVASDASIDGLKYTPTYSYDEAVEDLNERFRENGLGYEYVNGEIVRIDNIALHTEVVRHALNLLTDPTFENANEEYLKAHEHYRIGNNKESLNECLKAFETTMKIICSRNKWKYEKTDTAKTLINILLSNKFLPGYNESQLNALNQQLVGTIPTVRNKNSGHGQGEVKIIVPKSLVKYMLYTTAATINLLVETQKERHS